MVKAILWDKYFYSRFFRSVLNIWTFEFILVILAVNRFPRTVIMQCLVNRFVIMVTVVVFLLEMNMKIWRSHDKSLAGKGGSKILELVASVQSGMLWRSKQKNFVFGNIYPSVNEKENLMRYTDHPPSPVYPSWVSTKKKTLWGIPSIPFSSHYGSTSHQGGRFVLHSVSELQVDLRLICWSWFLINFGEGVCSHTWCVSGTHLEGEEVTHLGEWGVRWVSFSIDVNSCIHSSLKHWFFSRDGWQGKNIYFIHAWWDEKNYVWLDQKSKENEKRGWTDKDRKCGKKSREGKRRRWRLFHSYKSGKWVSVLI